MTRPDELALSGAGVRAVVIGTGTHTAGSRLPDVPEVAGTLELVSHCLVEQCGLAEARLRVVRDPDGPEPMLDAIMAAAGEADDVLLIYYVGHGLLSMSGELHLATRATRDLTLGKAAYQALPYNEIRSALVRSRAASVAVVLDCCFSGRAELPRGRGLVLTSASGEQTALIPPGATYPAFSGELVELLANGDPDGPPFLSLDHVDRYLKRRLREHGLPVPRMQDRERARELVLARNAAYHPPPEWEPAPGGQVEDICPYQGLAAYGREDARFFRGRAGLTADLVGRLAGQAWTGGAVAVVGPSGSGKSSLLSAGLLPAIARGELGVPGSSGWPQLPISPGADPLGALATGLLGLSTSDSVDPVAAAELAAGLLADPEAVRPAVRDACRSFAPGANGSRLVLVIDQFEELFTQCLDEKARHAFVAALDAAARPGEDEDGSPTLVVFGVRGDFYGHCVDFPQLKAILEDRQLLVGAMTTGEVREAIEEPARITGRGFEPGLVELLLRDLGCDPADRDATGHEAGSLPLLSHTLREIWRRRRGRVLTVQGYRETGGIGQALGRTADATLAGLPESARDAMRRMLPRLVTVTDGAPDTLRRVNRDALLAGLPDSVAGEQVLQVLAAARLITVDANTVTITHEALIHSWPTLQNWIDADREWLRATQQLTADATAWDTENRESARLYRGAVLAAMLQRTDADRRQAELPPVAGAFLEAALRQERIAVRRRRTVITALATITIVALVAAGLAVLAQRVADRERANAEAQRDIAIARAVAAKAQTFKRTDPRLARQLTVAAHRIAPQDIEVTNSVLAAGDVPKVVRFGEEPVRPRTRFTSDGQALIIGHDKGFEIRDAATLERLSEATVAEEGSDYKILIGVVTDLTLGPGDRLLAITGQSGLGLWDISDRRLPRPVSLQRVRNIQANNVPVNYEVVAFGPNGSLLAYSGGTDGVALLDTTDPRRPRKVGEVPGSGAAQVRFSADGRMLAVPHDEKLTLWDVADAAHPVLLATLPDAVDDQNGNIQAPVVEFGAGNLLAYSGTGNLVRLWNITDPRSPTPAGTIGGHASTVTSLAVSADGQVLISGSADGGVQFTQVDGLTVLGRIEEHTDQVTGTALAPGGNTMATTSTDGTLRLWPFADPRRRPALGSITGPRANGVLAASPDRGLTVTGGKGNAEVSLWDSRDPTRLALLGAIDVGGDVAATAISRDGRLLVVARESFDPPVLLVDIGDPRKPRRVATLADVGSDRGLPALPSAVAFSGDGRLLAVGNMVGQIQVYDVRDPAAPNLLNTFNRGGPQETDRLGWIRGLAFDPTRPLLAVASWGRTTSLFDLSDVTRPVMLAQVERHEDDVIGIAIGADGHWMASTDRAGTILVWDIRELPGSPDALRPVATFTESTDNPVVDFSPDGRRLVSAVADRTIRIWELGSPVGPVQTTVLTAGGGSEPRGVVFGPNGETVLLAVEGAAVDVFAVDARAMARLLCSGAGDRLSEQEWRRFLPDRPYEPPCP